MSHAITIEGPVTIDEIASVLREHYARKNVQVRVVDADTIRATTGNDKESLDTNKDVIISTLPMTVKEALGFKEMLEFKAGQLEQLDIEKSRIAESASGYQKQHQAMYDRFLALRTQFDEQKTSLLKTLWVHCGSYHPDLREIPVLETSAKFIETDLRVGEYYVGEILGQGQFATVKACRREGSESDNLAVKIIKKDRFTTFVSLKRISIEIETLRRLTSPHIIAIKDVVQTNNYLYLVTERGGKDLFESFEDHVGGIPEGWARDIIVGVFHGESMPVSVCVYVYVCICGTCMYGGQVCVCIMPIFSTRPLLIPYPSPSPSLPLSLSTPTHLQPHCTAMTAASATAI